MIGAVLAATLTFTNTAIERPSKPGYAAVDIRYPRIAHPANDAQRALDRALDAAALGDRSWEKPMDPADSASANLLYYRVKGSVTTATATFVSVKLRIDAFSGGAHGLSATANVNFDLRSGRPIAASSVLRPGALDTIATSCLAQVRRYFRRAGQMNETVKLADVRTAVAQTSSWSLADGALTITFNPYDIASYAAGPSTCTIPAATLRGLRAPNAPF